MVWWSELLVPRFTSEVIFCKYKKVVVFLWECGFNSSFDLDVVDEEEWIHSELFFSGCERLKQPPQAWSRMQKNILRNCLLQVCYFLTPGRPAGHPYPAGQILVTTRPVLCWTSASNVSKKPWSFINAMKIEVMIRQMFAKDFINIKLLSFSNPWFFFVE